MQRRSVDWQRRQAAPLLERPVAELNGGERNRLRWLAVSLHELGQIQRSQEQSACVRGYQESLELAEKIGDSALAAICALNLGHAYSGVGGIGGVPALRDLAQAEHWYRRSLELCPKDDHSGQAKCYGQLGAVVWERVREAMAAEQPSEAEAQVETALEHYHQALALLPADAVNDLAVTHNQLGMIYRTIGQLEPALRHYRSASALMRRAETTTARAQRRPRPAPGPAPPRALAYARAALRGFQHYGEREQDIDQTQAFIDHIEQAGTGVQR